MDNKRTLAVADAIEAVSDDLRGHAEILRCLGSSPTADPELAHAVRSVALALDARRGELDEAARAAAAV